MNWTESDYQHKGVMSVCQLKLLRKLIRKFSCILALYRAHGKPGWQHPCTLQSPAARGKPGWQHQCILQSPASCGEPGWQHSCTLQSPASRGKPGWQRPCTLQSRAQHILNCNLLYCYWYLIRLLLKVYSGISWRNFVSISRQTSHPWAKRILSLVLQYMYCLLLLFCNILKYIIVMQC